MQKSYPVWSFNFWKCYLITCRPYLMFLSGISGLSGMALTDVNPMTESGAIIFFAFFISYGVGQALTDVFQTDTDSISSPYRPLTQGLITKRAVFVVSFIGLTLCGITFAYHNPYNVGLAILSIIGLATYTFFKRRWWGGPFWNSWIVSLLPLMGATVLGFEHLTQYKYEIIYLMLSTHFSYAIFVLLGYFKDISADKQTGYNTMPVIFGWRTSVHVSTIYAFLSILFSLLLIRHYEMRLLPDIVWLIGAGCLIYSHKLMYGITHEDKAHLSIAYVVRGYVWIHAGEILFLQRGMSWIILSLVYLLLFEAVLRIRPEVKQI